MFQKFEKYELYFNLLIFGLKFFSSKLLSRYINLEPNNFEV